MAPHLPETYFLFKNYSSVVWRHFRAMRIFCIDGHYFAFLKIMKILKLLFLFTIATTNQKKLFIYYNFLLKVVHTIKLSFSISRELNKFAPRAFCLSNIGWYQRRSYSLLSDSRKRRDLLYGKTKPGQMGCVGLPILLKGKATMNLSVADIYRFTRKYPFT